MKKTLTKEQIIKDQNFGSELPSAVIFTVLGIVIPLLPLTAEKPFNAIIGVFFCAFVFGIPFGYLFGIKNLVKILEIKNALKKNTFKITVDTVVDVKRLNCDLEDKKKSRKEFQIAFKKFSKETNKYYVTTRRVWQRARKGDEYYLIYIGNLKNTIAVYPLKDYQLGTGLMFMG